ncbi:hypothetical protein ACOMHN_014168 [Nucella lapillus]
MVVKVAVILRTNIPGSSVHNQFLSKFSEFLVKEFCTQLQHVTVEVQTDCTMVRGGSTSPMAVLQLYHNDDRCTDDTKHQYAEHFARFLAHDNIRIPADRQVSIQTSIYTDKVLVLFHDTRRCSQTSQHM